MRVSSIAALLFSSAVLAVCIGGRVDAAAKKVQQVGTGAFAWAVCNTSDIVTMMGRNGPLAGPDGAKKAVLLLQARIATCKWVIDQFLANQSPPAPIVAQNPPGLPALPTPAPATTKPPGCVVNSPQNGKRIDDPIQLYSNLTYCANWIASNIPSPAAAGTPTPKPIALHPPFAGMQAPWQKAVYVMALASDPGLSAQISLQLANNLRAPGMQAATSPPNPTPDPEIKRDIYSNRLVQYRFIAAPTWTLEKYQQQCFTDPSTAGAIVALQPGTNSQFFNAIFGFSWTTLNEQLMVLDCEPTNTSYTNNAAYIIRMSHVRARTGSRLSINLATALGALAIAYAFQSATTTTFTLRKPKPLPGRGGSYESEYVVNSPQSTAASTSVGVASALGSSGLALQQPSIDNQTAGAIAKLLPPLLDDLMQICRGRGAVVPFKYPEPQCDWLFYRPTKDETP